LHSLIAAKGKAALRRSSHFCNGEKPHGSEEEFREFRGILCIGEPIKQSILQDVGSM
jgi:hypothetical protein